MLQEINKEYTPASFRSKGFSKLLITVEMFLMQNQSAQYGNAMLVHLYGTTSMATGKQCKHLN